MSDVKHTLTLIEDCLCEASAQIGFANGLIEQARYQLREAAGDDAPLADDHDSRIPPPSGEGGGSYKIEHGRH